MTTDYRAMCAELVDAYVRGNNLAESIFRACALLDQPVGCTYPSCVEDSEDERCSRWLTGECQGPDSGARILLAQPVAEGPTDEELLRTYGIAKRDHCYEGDLDDWLKKSERAATVAGIRAALARWGRPTPQPVAEELTDEEIQEWADACSEAPLEEMDPEVHGWRRCFTAKEFSETIRAAIARWGRPAALAEPEVGDRERLRLVAAGIRYGYIAGHNDTVEAAWGDPDEFAADYAPEIFGELDAVTPQKPEPGEATNG